MSHCDTLARVIERIEQARLRFDAHHIVKIVAVSKYNASEDISMLYSCGQRAFGESRVQDLIQKQEELAHYPLEWHFIGRLQKNKINHLLSLRPALIHSVDSLELAKEIDKRIDTSKSYRPKVLLQVNSALEASKTGVHPDAAFETYAQIESSCPNLILSGIMSIGAHSDDTKVIEKSFLQAKHVFDSLPESAKILSLGMSNDFELAIQCGSNLIRLGSILFK